MGFLLQKFKDETDSETAGNVELGKISNNQYSILNFQVEDNLHLVSKNLKK